MTNIADRETADVLIYCGELRFRFYFLVGKENQVSDKSCKCMQEQRHFSPSYIHMLQLYRTDDGIITEREQCINRKCFNR